MNCKLTAVFLNLIYLRSFQKTRPSCITTISLPFHISTGHDIGYVRLCVCSNVYETEDIVSLIWHWCNVYCISTQLWIIEVYLTSPGQGASDITHSHTRKPRHFRKCISVPITDHALTLTMRLWALKFIFRLLRVILDDLMDSILRSWLIFLTVSRLYKMLGSIYTRHKMVLWPLH